MKRVGFLAVMMLALGAADARAQMSMGSFKGYLTGHIGGTNGGNISSTGTVAGGSVSVNEQSGGGAELDLGVLRDVRLGGQELDVITYMVNGSWIHNQDRMLRPFFVAGGGVFQVDGCNCALPARTFDFGVGAGGGVVAALSDFVGVRADARYFRSFAEHPELARDAISFWRLSAGVTFIWATR